MGALFRGGVSRLSTLWLSVFLPMLFLVGCDHATKLAAKTQLEDQPPKRVVSSLLQLKYAENTDVAFNLLRAIPERVRGPLLLVAGGLAVVALVLLLLRAKVGGVRKAALVMITAGALGNYGDRLLRGYVVDFIQVPHWPVFNVADVWVVVGVALLGWATLRQPEPARAA